jgi:rhodanese-related sulfurtransferase
LHQALVGLLAWGLLVPTAALAKRASPTAAAAIPPVEARALYQRGAGLLVDVREREELREVIEGAQWTPTSQLEQAAGWASFVRSLPRNKTIVFFCVVAVRARWAAERLHNAGFAAAWFDGPAQWKAAGLPLKVGPAAATSPQGTPPSTATR